MERTTGSEGGSNLGRTMVNARVQICSEHDTYASGCRRNREDTNMVGAAWRSYGNHGRKNIPANEHEDSVMVSYENEYTPGSIDKGKSIA